MGFWNTLADHALPTPLTVATAAQGLNGAQPRVQDLELPQLLREAAKRSACELGELLVAAWAAVLSRYSGEQQVLIGYHYQGRWLPRSVNVTASARRCAWLEDLRGWREQVPQRPDKDEIRQACPIPSGLPLFESALSAEPGAVAEVPLALLLETDAQRIRARYDASRLTGATVSRLLGHLARVALQLVTEPERTVGELELMGEAERRAVLELNATSASFPEHQCIHALFEARAQEVPDAPAIWFRDQVVSYRQLSERANRLARYLRGKGVGPDVCVAVFMERSIELVVGILGILKAGGAFAPLDPSYPVSRLVAMIDDAEAPVLLTQHHLRAGLGDELNQLPVSVVSVDTEWAEISSSSCETPETEVEPENLAYVIYTSGSTGTPKGVSIRHRGALNNLYDLNTRFSVGAGDRVLAVSSLSFDMSVYEILGTLTAGAGIVMPEAGRNKEPTHWLELVHQHGVTVWNSAPQILDMLLTHVEASGAEPPRSLRLTILGGDWVPPALPDRFKALTAPGAQVIVLGGATEASIHSTIYPVLEPSSGWPKIPYGKPMANQSCVVLDPEGRLCPIGVPGELHLGGVGLARGYLNRPELTASKFIPDPFSSETGARLYRTSDLVKLGEDGLLELLGRIDFMVKIRGFRVELGEIEASLRKHSAVREAVVMARQEQGSVSEQRLVAYIVAEPNRGLGSEAAQAEDVSAATLVGLLRAHLGASMPSHMVPSAFVLLDALPLTPNGKVNRRALPIPNPLQAHRASDYVAPRDALEQMLAALWVEVLGVGAVGAHDNFFDLGGHSLAATQISSRLRNVLPMDIPLATLLRFLTIAELAGEIRRQGGLEGVDPNQVAEVYLEIAALSDEEVALLLSSDSSDSWDSSDSSGEA